MLVRGCLTVPRQPVPCMLRTIPKISTTHLITRFSHSAKRASAYQRTRWVPWIAGIAGGTGIFMYGALQLRFLHEKKPSSLPKEPLTSPPKKDEVREEPLRPFHVQAYVVSQRLLHDYIYEPLCVITRFVYLAILFAPAIVTFPMLFIGNVTSVKSDDGEEISKERWGALWWYNLLVAQMERAGPTFVKLGQWAGSRRDLFPESLCNSLAKLHSNNKPHSMSYTKRVLEDVFKRPFDEIFEAFDEKVIGAGAVGQVYKAVLRQDLLPLEYLEDHEPHTVLGDAAQKIGRELALTYEHDPHRPTAAVAVKVLHPNVRSTISHDIAIMHFFASMVDRLPGMKWVSLPQEVDNFAKLMFSQLDMRVEAMNLVRFEKNFAGRGGTVIFPRPLSAFCSRDVLVEEIIEAIPLKYFMKLGGLDYDSRIAELGLDTFLSMLLIDNFVHADLHPGNIMVKFYRPTTRSMLQNVLSRVLSRFDPDYVLGNRKNTGIHPNDDVVATLRSKVEDRRAWLAELSQLEDEGYLPELVLLDAGLVSELSPTNQRNFLDLFAAIATFDGRRSGELMVDRCRSPELVIGREQFVERMGKIVDQVRGDTFCLANLNIGHVLSQVLQSVRTHHVRMESDFVDTVLSIMILEGIGRRLDPDLDLFRTAVPILRSLGHRVSGDESEQLVALRENLTLSKLLPMVKLWFIIEGRALVMPMLGSQNLVDAFVRYGWFSE